MNSFQQPARDPVAARRFGVALVSSALVIAAVAFLVHEMNPGSALRPNFARVESGMATLPASGDARYNNVLSAFVEALQREDDAALRAVYPTLTERDARILHSVRRRLGPATLRVGDLKVGPAQPDKVAVEFVVVTNGSKEMRLPFAATLAKLNGEWRIAELH